MSLTIKEHLLIKLNEECSEVSKEVCKSLIFGISEKYEGVSNEEKLTNEIVDILATIELLIEEGIIVLKSDYTREKIRIKKEKVKHYLRYSQDLGLTKRRIKDD